MKPILYGPDNKPIERGRYALPVPPKPTAPPLRDIKEGGVRV